MEQTVSENVMKKLRISCNIKFDLNLKNYNIKAHKLKSSRILNNLAKVYCINQLAMERYTPFIFGILYCSFVKKNTPKIVTSTSFCFFLFQNININSSALLPNPEKNSRNKFFRDLAAMHSDFLWWIHIII